MSETALIDLKDYIAEKMGVRVLSTSIDKSELVVTGTLESLVDILKFFRDDSECQFTQLIDICGVDYPEREARFDVIYNFLSMRQNQRVRLKVSVGEGQAVASATSLFSTAGWFEREVWDLYGIPFDGNADMRRILTDYGFEGHPLRKDFPLTGHVEMRYDETEKRVVYDPVSLPQDYRNFDFESPWEEITDIQLGGDEKAMKPERGYREKKA